MKNPSVLNKSADSRPRERQKTLPFHLQHVVYNVRPGQSLRLFPNRNILRAAERPLKRHLPIYADYLELIGQRSDPWVSFQTILNPAIQLVI